MIQVTLGFCTDADSIFTIFYRSSKPVFCLIDGFSTDNCPEKSEVDGTIITSLVNKRIK